MIPSSDVSYKDAMKFVQDIHVSGDGWRLPTIKELLGIYDKNKKSGKSGIDPIFEIGSGFSVWSVEENDTNDWVRVFRFNLGRGSWFERSVHKGCRAFGCV